MVKGLYIAATGLLATKRGVEHISNNLANIETTGFKKDVISLESFHARLLTRRNGTGIPYEYGSNRVSFEKNGEIFSASTEQGYFRVKTEDGIHHAKELKFIIGQDGKLITLHKANGGDLNYRLGDEILSEKGESIHVGVGSEVEIDDSGKLLVNGEERSDLLVYLHPKSIGTISAGTKRFHAYTNFEQGVLEVSPSMSAVAIQGEGFFRVNAGGKEYLTRNGNFVVDGNGKLVTVDGATVIGLNGEIVLDSTPFAINEFGEIIQNGQTIDTIQTMNVTNTNDIEKVGAYYFRLREDLLGEVVPMNGKILQNFIERSNSSAIEEMVRLIEMHRSYESSQKAVTTIDDMLSKAVNDIGKV